MIAVVVAKRESVADALKRLCEEIGLDWQTARHIPVLHFAAIVDAHRKASRS